MIVEVQVRLCVDFLMRCRMSIFVTILATCSDAYGVTIDVVSITKASQRSAAQ